MSVYIFMRCFGVTKINNNVVFGATVCNDVTELSATDSGSIDYPTNGVYADNMKCLWRIHAPAGMVRTVFVSTTLCYSTNYRFVSS